jgi:hypothetical protein
VQEYVGPWCPTCGAFSIPLVYGRATGEAFEAAAEGLIALAGCLRDDRPGESWRCFKGHAWPADDERWASALFAAIRARPACPRCGGPSAEMLYPSYPDMDVWEQDLALGAAVVAEHDPGPDTGPWYSRRCQDCHHEW